MKEHIGRILLSEDMILQRVQELGQQISNDYQGREITIVCVLKGAVIFLADLLRSLDASANLDFIQVYSYGDGTETTGEVSLTRDLTVNIQGRDVLVVDDIADSGLTLQYLRKTLLAKQPASLKLCVLLNKTERRIVDLEIDYVGFEIPDEFIVGYGLDYAGHYRGLCYIATLEL